MFSPKINHIKYIPNDFKTINPTSNLHYSKSRISKLTDNSQKDKLLRLIQINPFKSKDDPKSPIKSKNNLTEIANIKYIPRRLTNLNGFSMELPLKNLGKSTLDCKKIFGDNSDNNEENKKKITNNKAMNIKSNSFRNEYIYKFSVNSNNFNKIEKYSEFISTENKNNFYNIYSKLKEILKNQIHIFFESGTNDIVETEKINEKDIKSGFYKYRSERNVNLPTISKTIASQEENETKDISLTEQNNPVKTENDHIYNQRFTCKWYEVGSLFNKLLILLLNDLRDCKNLNKKLNQKMMEYEIRLANNNKEIENMKKFLNKYEVSSKIYLKIKNEKELDKVKASFNQKENNYIMSIYKLEEEIKNLTLLLDSNQKYYHECKNLEKQIEIGKKKNEELKFMFNQELHEKNMQKAIERETEEDLKQKMENLNEIIEDLKKEGDKRRKNDIENQIKIKKLSMNLDEKKENIVMLNEELEWYIRELDKTKNDLKITKIDLSNLENIILNKLKEKEKEKEKEKQNNENENENDKKEINESVQANSNNYNYNNYSLDNEKDKDRSNSDIPNLNLSLLIKNSPKS